MSLRETFVDVVTTPWIVASALAGSVAKLAGISPLLDFFISLASQWFAPLAIFAGTIAPELDWVPTQTVMGAFLGIAIVVFLARVDRTVEWMRNRYS